MLKRAGHVITVFRKGTRVAASKSSSRTGKLCAIQSLEDWHSGASNAVIQTGLDTAGTQASAETVAPSRDLTGATLFMKHSWRRRLASQGAPGTQGRLLDTLLVCLGRLIRPAY